MNKNINLFNIRVYGLIIKNDAILISKEIINGKEIYKFPGGGLEFGEGLIDGLKREFMEEMNQEIFDIVHYYTTDFFQISQFNENEQLISVYYTCKIKNELVNNFKKPKKNKPIFIWKNIHDFSEKNLKFPIDKIVYNKIKLQKKGS